MKLELTKVKSVKSEDNTVVLSDKDKLKSIREKLDKKIEEIIQKEKKNNKK